MYIYIYIYINDWDWFKKSRTCLGKFHGIFVATFMINCVLNGIWTTHMGIWMGQNLCVFLFNTTSLLGRNLNTMGKTEKIWLFASGERTDCYEKLAIEIDMLNDKRAGYDFAQGKIRSIGILTYGEFLKTYTHWNDGSQPNT